MSFSEQSAQPIGLFDSGVGGLTVMREVVKHLPQENIIYFGDTARLPYGNKSPETVLRYSQENVAFLIEQKIKLLILACFTASTHALEDLQQKLSIPVIGVIQSGIEELMDTTRSKRVAILGTSSTIQSGVLQKIIQERDSSTTLFPIACPLFVPLIEEGFLNHTVTRIIAGHYLGCLKNQAIDSALLACTHYPLIHPIIQETLGPNVQLIQPAKGCAEKAKDLLSSQGLLNPNPTFPDYQFFVSDAPDKFRCLTDHFFGSEIGLKKIRICEILVSTNLRQR